MPDRSKTRDPRPRDPNARAFQIILEATGQAPKTEPSYKKPKPIDPTKNPHAVARKRSQIAAKAAKARWGTK